MRSPWAKAVDFRRGWLGRLGALAALFGFLFASTTPSLALVTSAGRAVTVNGFLGVYICHAQDGQRADLPGEASAAKGECCLVCQAQQLANGAVPPQHFTLPTESAACLPVTASARSVRDGEALDLRRARAPPVL